MTINFDDLMDGKLAENDAKEALISLHKQGESVEDIKNAMLAMRKRMITIDLPQNIQNNTIDNCGTGGDGLHTFNISSICAIILASLECFVPKHGNRSITSKSGSADMLEVLGVKLNLTPQQNLKLLIESGFCFLFAQNHHPCMKFIMPIRKAIPHRTIFNILGPLCNPAGVTKHIIGVFDFDIATKMAQALKETGSTSGITVCSQSNADEALPFECTNIAKFDANSLSIQTLQPYVNGNVQDLIGGDAKLNAKITTSMLSGQIKGVALETILLNSALGLIAAQKTNDIENGKQMALEAIKSGGALKKLQQIIEISNKI